MEPISFLSFDLEALPARAEKDHIDRLIWGKINGQEKGLRRICKILDDYKIKGNFLLDLSGCILYGDNPIAEIGRYVLNAGHELHVHLHAEWLVRKLGIRLDTHNRESLDLLDEDLNQSFLKYAFFKYRQLFGSNPCAFRSGEFTFNRHTITAARDAGFRIISNFNEERHANILSVGPNFSNNESFSWGGGLLEIPVDISPEPLSSNFDIYLGRYDRVRNRKKNKIINLTLHSWSLLKREGEIFTDFSQEYEDKLRQICKHLSENTSSLGYSEYFTDAVAAPVEINYFKSQTASLSASMSLVTCNICSLKFPKPKKDLCPGCEASARHRQVVDALGKIDNPFNGQRVLACHANSIEKLSILSGAMEIKNFDIRPEADTGLQMDIQHMDAIHDESFDCFFALHVLNHVKDDRQALYEIHRILKPGGMALITVPYRVNEPTSPMDDVLEHYGLENYEKYGVETYRIYGLNDVINLFSDKFNLKMIDGFDSVSGEHTKVFLLSKTEN
jgi:predicted SAM-dependent methyltransferase